MLPLKILSREPWSEWDGNEGGGGGFSWNTKFGLAVIGVVGALGLSAGVYSKLHPQRPPAQPGFYTNTSVSSLQPFTVGKTQPLATGQELTEKEIAALRQWLKTHPGDSQLTKLKF